MLFLFIFHEDYGYDPLRMRRNNKKETYREVNKSHIINYEKFLTMKEFIELIQDIWDFLKVRKKYWLAPLIITILLMEL